MPPRGFGRRRRGWGFAKTGTFSENSGPRAGTRIVWTGPTEPRWLPVPSGIPHDTVPDPHPVATPCRDATATTFFCKPGGSPPWSRTATHPGPQNNTGHHRLRRCHYPHRPLVSCYRGEEATRPQTNTNQSWSRPDSWFPSSSVFFGWRGNFSNIWIGVTD